MCIRKCETVKQGIISRIATEKANGDEYTVTVLEDLLTLFEETP